MMNDPPVMIKDISLIMAIILKIVENSTTFKKMSRAIRLAAHFLLTP